MVETTWRFKPHDALIRIVAGTALEEAMKEAHRSGAVSRAYAIPLPSQTALAGEGVSHVRRRPRLRLGPGKCEL